MTILMAGCFKWVKTKKEVRNIKLVIVGLDNAGKTTTITSLQGEPPDGIAPTVGFSNAKMTINRWNIVIYDLGGGTGVRSVWQKYYAEVYGIVFAVDAGDHERMLESKSVLREMFSDEKVRGKPLLVFANKQDKAGALNEDEITERLSLRELAQEYQFKYNVFSCSAIKGYGKTMDRRIRSGLEWLLSSIDDDFVRLDEKVTREAAIQLEQQLKEKKERMERIKKLREEREKAAKEAGVVEDKEESDDDVVTNPFRSINQQIEVTEKREKAAKEKTKRINEYEMNKKKEQEASQHQQPQTNHNPRSKQILVGGSESDEDYEDIGKHEEDDGECDGPSNSNVKPIAPTQNGHLPNTKRRRKKKPRKSGRDGTRESSSDDEEETNNVAVDDDRRTEISPRKRDESGNGVVVKRRSTDSELVDECEDKLSVDRNNIISVSDLNYINASNDHLPRKHNIILVGSKENVREASPVRTVQSSRIRVDDNLCLVSVNDETEVENSARAKEIRNSSETTVDSQPVVDGRSTPLTKKEPAIAGGSGASRAGSSLSLQQKELNDSRAEMFRARSTDSLRRNTPDNFESSPKKKKKSKKKKKKSKNDEVVEFHCDQDDDYEPDRILCNKPATSGSNMELSTTGAGGANHMDGFPSNGTTLPPIRGASKLEPINLKGRLPKWSNDT